MVIGNIKILNEDVLEGAKRIYTPRYTFRRWRDNLWLMHEKGKDIDIKEGEFIAQWAVLFKMAEEMMDGKDIIIVKWR